MVLTRAGFIPWGLASDVPFHVDFRAIASAADQVAALAAFGGALTQSAATALPTFDPVLGLVGTQSDTASERGGVRFTGATFQNYITSAIATALRTKGSIYLEIGRNCFKTNAPVADENFFEVRTSPGGVASSVPPLFGRYGASNNFDTRWTGTNYATNSTGTGLKDCWDLLPEKVRCVISYQRGFVFTYIDDQLFRVDGPFTQVNTAGHSPNFQYIYLGCQGTVATGASDGKGSAGLRYPDNIYQAQICVNHVHMPLYTGMKNLVYFFGGTDVNNAGWAATEKTGISVFSFTTTSTAAYQASMMAQCTKAFHKLGYRGFLGHASGTSASWGNLPTHVTNLRTKGARPGIVVLDYFSGEITGTNTAAVVRDTYLRPQCTALFALGVEKILINNCVSPVNNATYNTQAKKDLCDSYNVMCDAQPAWDSRISIMDKFTLCGGHSIDTTLFNSGSQYHSPRGQFLVARDLLIPKLQEILRAG